MPLPFTPRRSLLAVPALALALQGCADRSTQPLVPATVGRLSIASFFAVAGTSVPSASRPRVLVVTADGTPVPGISVTFAVASGGGNVQGPASVLTDAEGTATVGGWILGPIVGPNTMTATVEGVTPATFAATGTPGPIAKLAVIQAPSPVVATGTVLPVQPRVEIQDANSNRVTSATVEVTATLVGSGELWGTRVVSAVAGVATYTDLLVTGAVGSKALRFHWGTAVTTAEFTVTPGAPASLSVHAGDLQAAVPGSPVATPPAARVRDAYANPVAGVPVTFTVTGGGGSVTEATTASDAGGIAAVGSWTLGPAMGTNTLTVTAPGVTTPLQITAYGSNVEIQGVTPAVLVSGASATITGVEFGSTIAENVVTIDGRPAVVTAASPTSLTVTVPILPCEPAHAGAVTLAVNGGPPVTRLHPVRAASERTLALGEVLILATAEASRCNELASPGARYALSVFNTNQVYSTTGAYVEIRGTSAAAPSFAAARPAPAMRSPAAPRRAASEYDAADRAHVGLLERHLDFLRRNGRSWRRPRAGASLRTTVPVARAVGDLVPVRIADLNAADYCQEYLDIAGRVAYAGTRAIIIEDQANALAGTIDSTYARIGTEFDEVMWPILETYFGDALANDAVLDANGRIVMVFSNKVRTFLGGGIAGFVSPCDFFAREYFASSNEGEFFYASAPLVSGNVSVANSPPRWAWSMSGTVIHEVKHIVSVGERFARNGGSVFEVSWLEETLARHSEELYERARYGLAQRANIGYGNAGNPVGPYCGVRLFCSPVRGIVRVFEELADGWYAAPHLHSPLGRFSGSDFSFYATGWSLVRWALDADVRSEAAILKGLTQEPTKVGLENFDTQFSAPFAAALPRWTLAMVLDDFPELTTSDPTIHQPSWNLRDVFQGYDADFAEPWDAWPLGAFTTGFGSFLAYAAVRPGTAAIVEIYGAPTAGQVIELRGSGGTVAPAELRLAIVRVR